MLDEQDLMKEIEKNKSKHSLITTKDLDNMVKEGDEKNVIMGEDETVEQKEYQMTKYDLKRELNNLIKESDVIIEVIDARDPLSYRSKELEKNIYNNKDKRLIIILNKVDLVSKENSEAWGKFIRRDIPCFLFSSKGEHDEKTFKELFDLIGSMTATLNKKIHVGFVGYPNTGKAAIIKSLKSKFVNLARGKTLKGFNEIIINNNLRFYDKSGIIFSKNEVGPLMPKSGKSSEEVKAPMEVVKTIVETISHDLLLETYEIAEFENHSEFLENVARHKNLLIKVFFYKFIFS
jgi:ribosome biogenesis GTPase A